MADPTLRAGTLTLHHMAIAVADMDESVAWYRDHFAAETVDAWDNPETGMKWTHMTVGDMLLELVKMPDLGTPEGRMRGYHHLAFNVADCDAAAKALSDKGVEVMVPPNDFPRKSIRWCFVKDCAGNVIELIAPLDDGEA